MPTTSITVPGTEGIMVTKADRFFAFVKLTVWERGQISNQ